ncbi:hypothetical protein E2C01_015355 [Portunus trituberculatus]|uniref:Uncharacterized protein n=1 Tax=Portunus trituberculatus TaxID=210409 RepID=A0A5B7DMR8_PORTR|nr:hypothetical protein [Portunus trituberculatus]
MTETSGMITSFCSFSSSSSFSEGRRHPVLLEIKLRGVDRPGGGVPAAAIASRARLPVSHGPRHLMAEPLVPDTVGKNNRLCLSKMSYATTFDIETLPCTCVGLIPDVL